MLTSQNCRMVWIVTDFWVHLIQPCCSGRLHRTVCWWSLKISKEGDSTNSLTTSSDLVVYLKYFLCLQSLSKSSAVFFNSSQLLGFLLLFLFLLRRKYLCWRWSKKKKKKKSLGISSNCVVKFCFFGKNKLCCNSSRSLQECIKVPLHRKDLIWNTAHKYEWEQLVFGG